MKKESLNLERNKKDGIFIDIDGKCTISPGDTYSQGLSDWMNKNSDNDDIYDPEDNAENSYSAMGIFSNNYIMLDSSTFENTSTDQVVNDIKNSGLNYKNILVHEPSSDLLQQVAKKHKKAYSKRNRLWKS